MLRRTGRDTVVLTMRISSTLWMLLSFCAVLPAQDFRATLNGTVLDTSAGAVPKARIEVTNTATGVVTKAETLENGEFSVPFLPPRTYTATAESPGFKKTVRANIILRAGQAFAITLTMQPGQVTEQITIQAETPLLETEKADRGTVIDSAKITELPPVSRDPLMLSVLVAGVVSHVGSNRPFDNGSIDQWTVNGGFQGQSSFLLDGAPNTALAGNNAIAVVPEPEAIQEFRLQTNSYDAQYGNSGSGIFSFTLKSGGNDLHGSVYYYDKSGRWAANNFQNNKAGVRKGASTVQQPGFVVGGPAYLPKLYNGRNKTFFFFAYEHYYDDVAATSFFSVPQPEMLNGDFSNLVAQNGSKITIYDPATGAFNSAGTWVRQPFPGNIIPANRIDPVARKILGYYPKPTMTFNPTSGYSFGDLFVPAGKDDPTNRFYNLATKIDQNFGSRDRIFIRFAANSRAEHKQTGLVNGPGEAETETSRVNRAIVADLVHTFSPTMIFNVNFSYNRFVQTSRGDANENYPITKLGFPQILASQIPYPNDFGIYQPSGYQQLGWNPRYSISNEFASHPNLTWIRGSHKLHAGVDMRLTQLATLDQGNQFLLSSSAVFTQANYLQGDANSGNSIASFLLGDLTGDSSQFTAHPYSSFRYFAPYFQDDWKVTRRLTLNLGLRWDFAAPVVERFNRINAGFDTTKVNSVNALIDRNMYPGTPTLMGGLLFAGVNGEPRSSSSVYLRALQPRAGVAYQIRPWLVFRGGWGRYNLNPSNAQVQTNGFSFTNSVATSNDNSRTAVPGLFENPFPNGTRLPYGAAQGDQTFLGSGFTYSNPNYVLGRTDQFSAGFQIHLPFESVLDASYVGSRGSNIESSLSVNNIPLNVRQQCDYYEGGNPTYCNTTVPNPFLGLAPFFGSSLYTATTITRATLLQTYPEFGGITENARNDTKSWYNSAQFTYETRMKAGFNVIATMTFAKLITQTGFNDVQRLIMQRGLDGTDIPRRFTLGGVYTLPFGKGQKLLTGSNPILSRVVSGWQLGWIFQWQSGTPVAMPGNVFLLNDPRVTSNTPLLPGATANSFSATKGQIFSPCAEVWNSNGTITPEPAAAAAGCKTYDFLVLPQYAPTVRPNYFPNLRNYAYPNLDASLSKVTTITERVKLQIRADVYDATNSVGRATPDTGVTSTTFGLVQLTNSRSDTFRTIQLSLKAIF